MATRQDRRVQRTRTALIDAFNHLVLHRRKRDIRVADIVATADVGRSTFYEHFSGAEAIHVASMARPFATLADAAAGEGDAHRLTALLAHFWENRQRARDSFSDRMGRKAAHLLADMVEARLEARGVATVLPRRLAAVQLAEAALAPIRAWVGGEGSATPEALAESLCRSGEALAAQLVSGPGGR